MASTSTLNAPSVDDDYEAPPEDKRLFYVEKVLDRKFIGNQKWYLIKWVGYSSAYNSWESLSNLEPGHENVALIDGDVVRWDNKMTRKGVQKLELKVKIRRKREIYRVVLNEGHVPLPVKKRKYVLSANICPRANQLDDGDRPSLSLRSKEDEDDESIAAVADSGIATSNGNGNDSGGDQNNQKAPKAREEVSEAELAAVRISARSLIDGIANPPGPIDRDIITFHAFDGNGLDFRKFGFDFSEYAEPEQM